MSLLTVMVTLSAVRTIPATPAAYWDYYEEMVATRLEDNQSVRDVLATLSADAPPPGVEDLAKSVASQLHQRISRLGKKLPTPFDLDENLRPTNRGGTYLDPVADEPWLVVDELLRRRVLGEVVGRGAAHDDHVRPERSRQEQEILAGFGSHHGEPARLTKAFQQAGQEGVGLAGRFRDDVRSFLRGDENTVNTLIARLYGSDDLFPDDRVHAFHPWLVSVKSSLAVPGPGSTSGPAPGDASRGIGPGAVASPLLAVPRDCEASRCP